MPVFAILAAPVFASLAMRYLVCLAGGLVIGALLALTAANILHARNAYPRALMTLMHHELGGARAAVHDGRCADAGVTAPIAHLRLLAGDIEPALLAPGAHDRVFSQYAADLGTAIDGFDASAAECAARAAALTKISNACDACHRDYQ